jgi:hypothetical protein
MSRAMLRKVTRAASLATTLCALILVSACNNSLYKVKPVSELRAMPASAASVDVGSYTFRAAPLLTDEETQELFESNLQLAGLLPVRMEIAHNGGEPLEFKKVRFRLHEANGTEWKFVNAKQAISRILKANGVFAYNPSSRKTFEKEFRAYEFDAKSPLTHSEGRRQGLIIFLAPQKQPVASPKNLVLSVEGLAQPVELKLN